MIELGKKQELIVVKIVDFGVYLGEREQAEDKDTVLLPKNKCPKAPGKERRFLYLYTGILLTV